MDHMHGYERENILFMKRIKLVKCVIRDGVRGRMKEAEESCLSCLLI